MTPCPHRHHGSTALLPLGLADAITGRVPLLEVRACPQCGVAWCLTGQWDPARRTLTAIEVHEVTVAPEGWLVWRAV